MEPLSVQQTRSSSPKPCTQEVSLRKSEVATPGKTFTGLGVFHRSRENKSLVSELHLRFTSSSTCSSTCRTGTRFGKHPTSVFSLVKCQSNISGACWTQGTSEMSGTRMSTRTSQCTFSSSSMFSGSTLILQAQRSSRTPRNT